MNPSVRAGRTPARVLIGATFLLTAAALGATLHQVDGEVVLDRFGARVIGPSSSPSVGTAVMLARLADRGPTVAYLLVVAVAAALLHHRARPVLAVLAAGGATQALVLLGKALVERTSFSQASSYPSGHVAGATAVLVLALLVVQRHDRATCLIGAVVGLLPVATALGAIWTQSHVWTDVVGGALTGAGASLMAWSALVPDEPSSRPESDRDPSVLPHPGSPLSQSTLTGSRR